jgi:hypothetical protein
VDKTTGADRYATQKAEAKADRARHVETGECGHGFARPLAQALSFGAEHERRKSSPPVRLPVRIEPIVWKPASSSWPKASARFFTSIWSTCSSGPDAALASTPDSCGLPRRRDQGAGAEGHRRAHDRAYIVRVGHLVEHRTNFASPSASSRFGVSGSASMSTP